MPDKNQENVSREKPDKQDRFYAPSADQSEVKRNRTTTAKVGQTPGQAEGEHDPEKYDPDRKPKTQS